MPEVSGVSRLSSLSVCICVRACVREQEGKGDRGKARKNNN